MSSDERVAICVASFYEDIAERLEESAREALVRAGFTEIDRFEVPGSFELPQSGRYAVIVALGAIIRGETSHYDYVCAETARGIQDVQLGTGVPVGFGVLTVDSQEQARARIRGGAKRDTGVHAVEAALASLSVKRELSQRPRRAGFSA